MNVELERWLEENVIITRADRVEATLTGEAMYQSVVRIKVESLSRQIEWYENALRVIAGLDQCADNLMGNVDIARKALDVVKCTRCN